MENFAAAEKGKLPRLLEWTDLRVPAQSLELE